MSDKYEQDQLVSWEFCLTYGCDKWAVYGDWFCPEHLQDPAFQVEDWNERP